MAFACKLTINFIKYVQRNKSYEYYINLKIAIIYLVFKKRKMTILQILDKECMVGGFDKNHAP